MLTQCQIKHFFYVKFKKRRDKEEAWIAVIPTGAVAVVGGLCYIVLKSKLVFQWAYFVSAFIQMLEADT